MFESQGFTMQVQAPTVLRILVQAAGSDLFKEERAFKDLRYIIIYLVLLLNTRNSERAPGRIAEFVPPAGNEYARSKYNAALMIAWIAPLLQQLPKEQQDDMFARMARSEYNSRAERLGLPLAPDGPKQIATRARVQTDRQP
jgi:hypothetical protein